MVSCLVCDLYLNKAIKNTEMEMLRKSFKGLTTRVPVCAEEKKSKMEL